MFSINLFGINSLILIVPVLVAFYLYLTRTFNFWKDRGIPGDKPIIFFGSIYKFFLKPKSELNYENYQKYGKVYGSFLGSRPILIIVDPELINTMNTRDFHIFVNRNDVSTGDDLNDRSLFNLMGDEWKKMRSVVSPTFSSGKMRKMHPMIIDCVKRLENHLENKALSSGQKELDLKKEFGSLTMDVIASCAFGTKIDTYSEENCEFITNAHKLFRPNWRVWFTFIMVSTFPKIIDWIGFKFFEPKVQAFFEKAVFSIISRRRSEKVKHNDYLQLILNAQNKTLDTEELEVNNESELFAQTDNEIVKNVKQRAELTDLDILATSFVFFIAGFETTASLLSHLFYSLAVNEEYQLKLYEEVKQFDGNYDFESFQKMPYLEACIAETLRLYPPFGTLGRMPSEDYQLGDTGLTVPKGMLCLFDITTIQHNPEYYPEPKKWIPDRFLPENRHKLTPHTYMPFGTGPRNCVGQRFALMEAKTCIAHLVNKFKFVRTDKTVVPLRPQKGGFILNTGKQYVRIELRNK